MSDLLKPSRLYRRYNSALRSLGSVPWRNQVPPPPGDSPTDADKTEWLTAYYDAERVYIAGESKLYENELDAPASTPKTTYKHPPIDPEQELSDAVYRYLTHYRDASRELNTIMGYFGNSTVAHRLRSTMPAPASLSNLKWSLLSHQEHIDFHVQKLRLLLIGEGDVN